MVAIRSRGPRQENKEGTIKIPMKDCRSGRMEASDFAHSLAVNQH